MAIDNISLRKFLRLALADQKKRRSLLRDDIRTEISKEAGGGDGGGDFFVPFWAAAKAHVKGWSTLSVDIPKLIAANKGRSRLYKIMQASFTEWWTKKRAWRNEHFRIFDNNIKAAIDFDDIGLHIKIDNILAGTIGEADYRLVYPYFSEDPAINLNGARIGIHILSQALPEYGIESFRLLDVIRGVSYSVNDCPMSGTEAEELKNIFNEIEETRRELFEEYV